MLGLLQIVRGPDQGKSFALARGTPIPIGRGDHNRIILNDPQVSRSHCQVQVVGDRVLLTDSRSATGTWVNGNQIKRHHLQPGDVLTLGDTQLSFLWSDADEKLTESIDPLPPS